MGSVATSGFSLSNLLQNLTSSGSSQLSAVLSSPSVQTALQASPSDAVALSDQALQLQETSLLFGNSTPPQTATIPSSLDPLTSILDAVDPTASSSTTPSTTTSTASLANQLSGYQSDLQSEEMQTLFGITSTAPQPSTLFNALG
jgi:hypothetical protein